MPACLAGAQIIVERRGFPGIDAQAELGPAPQDVFGGLGPFVSNEVVDLALAESCAEVAAEIALSLIGVLALFLGLLKIAGTKTSELEIADKIAKGGVVMPAFPNIGEPDRRAR